MHLSLLMLAASVSTALAAPRIDIEAQVVLGCNGAASLDPAAFDSPRSSYRKKLHHNKLETAVDDGSISPAAVQGGKYDFGLIAGTGWSTEEERKQFIAVVADDDQAMVRYYRTEIGWNDGWQKIGGSFPDRTLAVHQFGDTAYISGVNNKGILLLKYFRAGKFYPGTNTWFYIDDKSEGTPAMANIDNRTLNIVIRGSNTKRLWAYKFDAITNEQSAKVISATTGVANPTLVSRTKGTLDVFQYVGDNKDLSQNSFDGDSWGASKVISKLYGAGSPRAITRDGRIDILAVGPSKRAFLNTYDGSKWISERNAGKDAVMSATPLYWKDKVFGYYPDSSTTKSVSWTDDDKTDPVDTTGVLWSPPVAFSWNGKTRIDLWGVGEGGQVFQRIWTADDGWGSWNSRGGSAKV